MTNEDKAPPVTEVQETPDAAEEVTPEEVAPAEKMKFNKVDTTAEKIIFFLFTIFFLFIVFAQMGTSDSYQVNSAVKNHKRFTSTLSDGATQSVASFEDIQTLEEFMEAYKALLGILYESEYYDGFPKTDITISQKGFNYLISSMRVTQRRMKLEPNDSPISKNFIAEKWAGDRIEFDEGKKSYESTDTYSQDGGSPFEYSKALSYENKGGYTIVINLYEKSYDETLTYIEEIEANGWLDDQTASLLLDFAIYNPYIDMIVYSRTIVTVEPSGRLITQIKTDALKRSYYTTGLDKFRAFCESVFLIICVLYVTRKLYEFYQVYIEIQKKYTKDKKKEERLRKEENKLQKSRDRVSEDNSEVEETPPKSKGKAGTFIKGILSFLSDPWNLID